MVTTLFSRFLFKKYLLGYSLLVPFASKHHIRALLLYQFLVGLKYPWSQVLMLNLCLVKFP